jgi:tRNA (cytidine32/uridine32-2'-O)-methyltransferase
MLKNIRIVLVRTFHPGNIGSAARAMKTMGLSDLVLVNPVDFPSDEALKMAASADDVLNNAVVVDSLYNALKDCRVIIASTARQRAYDLPGLNPEQSAQALLASAVTGKVALLFGPERMGLSNEDLQQATQRVFIPTHPDYSSLNLAAAVQTLCYEIYKQSIAGVPVDAAFKQDLPSLEDRERFYQHLQETLSETGFIIKNHPGEVMQKFRHLFGRAQPTVEEMNILRGALASVQRCFGSDYNKNNFK